MSELRECPFCGMDGFVYMEPSRLYVVVCLDCEAKGPGHATRHDAEIAWNSRASDCITVTDTGRAMLKDGAE